MLEAVLEAEGGTEEFWGGEGREERTVRMDDVDVMMVLECWGVGVIVCV